MIAAFARAGRILRRRSGRGAHWINRAARAARFVRAALWQPDTQTLHRRWRAGEAGIAGYCEDYAGSSGAARAAAGRRRCGVAGWARELQAAQDGCSGTRRGRRLVQHDRRDPSRPAPAQGGVTDGAEPAAARSRSATRSSWCTSNLTRPRRWIARTPAARVARPAAPCLVHGHDPGRLASRPDPDRDRRRADRDDTRALQRVIAGPLSADSSALPLDPAGSGGPGSLGHGVAVAASLTVRDGVATAYVCRPSPRAAGHDARRACRHPPGVAVDAPDRRNHVCVATTTCSPRPLSTHRTGCVDAGGLPRSSGDAARDRAVQDSAGQ